MTTLAAIFFIRCCLTSGAVLDRGWKCSFVLLGSLVSVSLASDETVLVINGLPSFGFFVALVDAVFLDFLDWTADDEDTWNDGAE